MGLSVNRTNVAGWWVELVPMSRKVDRIVLPVFSDAGQLHSGNKKIGMPMITDSLTEDDFVVESLDVHFSTARMGPMWFLRPLCVMATSSDRKVVPLASNKVGTMNLSGTKRSEQRCKCSTQRPEQ